MYKLPVKVGVVGCGNVSRVYLENMHSLSALEIAACADLVPERAITLAVDHRIPSVCTVDEILADPAIEIVLNLTTPQSHAGMALAALRAGKSVYNEKPLAVTREDGRKVLDLARSKNLRVGAAPDTFLGAGYQTARKLIDEGAIGTPVAATAFMLCHGPETWHPDPAFFYKNGGGPLMDMGPYYLTALIHLLGPVRRVSASARATFAERTVSSEPKRGQRIRVDVPTHVAGLLEFANGSIATLVTSFDVWHASVPQLEVYGSEGSLGLPDPNAFGGPVLLRKAADAGWTEVPLAFEYVENWRGLGLADMAHAMTTGRAHRASGELAWHVLDIMHGLLESAESAKHVELSSTCDRPAPMPSGLPVGILDD